jgi:vacuole morphology and inheritance protein 14
VKEYACINLTILLHIDWVPGQGVKVNHAAIVEILINQLDGERKHDQTFFIQTLNNKFIDDEIQQSTALKWLHEFLGFAQDVVVPFTPRLIPAVLPNLAHHAPDIQSAAIKTNQLLFNVIQNLPAPRTTQNQTIVPARGMSIPAPSPARSNIPVAIQTNGGNILPSSSPQSPSPIASRAPDLIETAPSPIPNKLRTIQPLIDQSSAVSSANSSLVDGDGGAANVPGSRPESPAPDAERRNTVSTVEVEGELDPFDYHATVSALTIRFLSEHEDTRVAALKWLIMLHQKAPNKVFTTYKYSIEHLSICLDSGHGRWNVSSTSQEPL